MKFKLLEIADFGMSERTLFDKLMLAHPRLRMNEGDVVVFLSKREDQLVFVHGYTKLDDGAYVLQSQRFRLTKGTWDILRLKEFTRSADIRITDWSVFEKTLKRAAARITAAVRQSFAA